VRRDFGICEAKASARPQQGSFWLRNIAIAIWLGTDSGPHWQVPPLDQQERHLSSYFRGVASPGSRAMHIMVYEDLHAVEELAPWKEIAAPDVASGVVASR
jgi:hypothetical protein